MNKGNPPIGTLHLQYGKSFTISATLSVHIVFSSWPPTTHQIDTDESALLVFKSCITSDPHNYLKNNWTAGTNVCAWNGVTCDSLNSRVTHVYLQSMGLGGSIPPEIGNLSFLVSLVLTENSFQGPLPKDICSHNNLPRLKEIQLSKNKLDGEIPLSLGECPQLETLDLFDNNFGGQVPTQIGNITGLERLDLSWNNLRGMILYLCSEFS